MTFKSKNEIAPELLTSSTSSIILRCPFPSCHARIIAYSATATPSVDIDHAPLCASIESYHSQKSDPKLSSSTTAFYSIGDVWDFDNIGVSKPSEVLPDPIVVGANGHEDESEKVDVERLLICSECDRGPLGFAGIAIGEDKTHLNLKYFLSQNSVLYDVGN
ncbi:hypothetical protein CANMA_002469 [Candida margitis]|uniref:uncharacterized protein n=1 Tax=Candida margitis TaxID=1775924 RepID=UPI002226CE2F|nr:uncharacterized protein CANMA_002469 [Candida margitis]KAI5968253.1 hypothetical protein CANMA_002469 [Candida margitis]